MFVKPTGRKRMLITGETGAGKTRSIRTFPGPKIVLVCPGELGQDTLLKSDGTPIDEDTKVIVWENDPEKPITSTAVIDAVRKQLFAIVKGTEGPIHTFCLDGVHKLYEYMIDAKSGGEYFSGSGWKTESKADSAVVDPRIAAQAEHLLADTLSIVSLSRIPIVVATMWDKDAGTHTPKINPDGSKEKWQDIPKYKMPGLYSAASKKILGMFSYCVYAWGRERRVEETMATGQKKWVTKRLYEWQTMPDAEIGACQIKIDDKIITTIPKLIPADWRELAKYVEGV